MNVTPNIMSIRELIDTAFGDSKENVVNHKLIHTVLVILARQLRLLERRVEVEIGPSYNVSAGSSLSITEVKLHANVPRKKRAESGTATTASKGARASEGRASVGKVVSLTSSGLAEKSINDKSTSSAATSSVVTSSATKSTTEPSSLMTSTEKSSSAKTKSSSDKTKSSTDTKLSARFAEQTTTSTTDRSTREKTSTSDKTATDTMSSDRTSTDKTSRDKSPSREKSSSEKPSAQKSSTHKTTDKQSSGQPLPQAFEEILGTIEEQREEELRIIHQRADSREEPGKDPTPIASMESMEKQYEKLLIVERAPAGGVSESRSQTGTRGKTPRLSVVTQNEFGELVAIVRQLQAKFAEPGTATFPGNAQLMDDLRKGASLTDAMAALQLAARVEAAEKALEKMLSLVTELASKTPGIDLEAITMAKATESKVETEVLFGAPVKPEERKKSTATAFKETATKSRKSIVAKSMSKQSIAPSMTSRPPSETQIDEMPPTVTELESKEPKDCVTYEELDNALQEIYDEFLKVVNTSNNRSNANANNALKIANKLESRLDEALDLGDRMCDLEQLVAEYAVQINALDTGLSSQMTNYQEQLTQMQHDLESGLETMAEALANTGGDTAAVAELNNHFTSLQNDIDTATVRQKELRDIQDALSFDLQSLWKQIEILRDTKSDRDEVADALRDKAGLAALNGLVSRQEFDAVRGDFEKRIGQAYDKFNNQEVVWQKAIDDLHRELGEKAEWIQLVSLQGSIDVYLDKLRRKIKDMAEIVGEPRAAAVTRKLHRDSDCLSCATPAHMDLEAKTGPPSLPAFLTSRSPAVGAEAESKPGEDGDHRICYPGMPVQHAVDPRAHVCHRYCGGSHTVINNTVSRAPPGMIISPALRKVNTTMGTDGKLYMVDEERVSKPCLPCNVKTTTTPEPSEAETAPNPEDIGSDMTPSDFRPSMQMVRGADTNVSITPPAPIDED